MSAISAPMGMAMCALLTFKQRLLKSVAAAARPIVPQRLRSTYFRQTA